MNIRLFFSGFALLLISSCVTTGGYMESSYSSRISHGDSNYHYNSNMSYSSSGSFDNSFHLHTN